jgi:hypothetical protein
MMLRNALWMLATLVIAAGAIAIGDDRFTEVKTQVACTGQPISRQLDNTLFTARALSQSGADPVCTPPVHDEDDLDGAMLSHRHGTRFEGLEQGFFGYQPRRR